MMLKTSFLIPIAAIQLTPDILHEAFAFTTVPPHSTARHRLQQRRAAYGRGADIWPPPPSDDVVTLADSFPNGILPPEAQLVASSGDISRASGDAPFSSAGDPPGRRRWKRLLPQRVARILRRAAARQEEEFSGELSRQPVDKTPAALAFALLFLGYVPPLDVMLVSFLSGYFVLLAVLSKSVRRDGVTPLLPALPPQGHVPLLVRHPLGPSFAYSILYDRWLKLGVGLGLIAPLLLGVHYGLSGQHNAAQLVFRPLFGLCCQAVSEAFSRRHQTPLPLRILVPIAYNTVRLGQLWHWMSSMVLAGDALGRVLSILSFGYWAANLFGFLLPLAALRYLRAHFLCVEVEQVTTRSGMEETLGLLS